MQSWDAKGKLLPLWERLPGKREELARLTGILGNTLSAYNSGARPLGIKNGRRIAAALEVSVLELGAPLEHVDPRGQLLVDRLEAIAIQSTNDVIALRKDLASAVRRIRALERRAPGGAGEGSG